MRQNAYSIRKDSFALHGASVNARCLMNRGISRLEDGEAINFSVGCISDTAMYCAAKAYVVKRMKQCWWSVIVACLIPKEDQRTLEKTSSPPQ